MKKAKNILLLVLGLAACQGHSGTKSTTQPIEHKDIILSGCPKVNYPATDINLTDLTSSPALYHGSAVNVTGYYHSSFEHSAIYPTPDSIQPDLDSGIWLLNMSRELHGKHVRVTGVFSSRIKGHLGQWPGSICVTSARLISE